MSFTDASFWTDRTDEQLKASIKGGKPGTAMPPFATLTDEQLDDLAAYLRSLQPTD